MNLFDPTEVFQNSAGNYVKTATRKTIHSHQWYRGIFKDISNHIPGKFALLPFQHAGIVNPLYHMVCNDKGLPVSIVSRSYALIDHCDVVSSLTESLKQTGRDTSIYPVEIYIGDGGAKFSLRIILSDIVCEPGDGHPVAGRLQVLNSVDRTIPFRLNMDHFRLVCSNGLVMWESSFDLLEVHLKGRLDQLMIDQAVREGLKHLQGSGKSFEAMVATAIPNGFTMDLIDRMSQSWGRHEAKEISQAWTNGIYRKVQVPGVNTPAESVWDLYSTLTWVSGRSRDLAGQLKTSETAHRILAEALRKHGISLN